MRNLGEIFQSNDGSEYLEKTSDNPKTRSCALVSSETSSEVEEFSGYQPV